MSTSRSRDPATIHPGLNNLEYISSKLGSLYWRFKEGEGLRYLTPEAFLAWKALPSSHSAKKRPFYVFLHDYGSSSRVFDKIVSQIANHCVAVDLKGWGRSDDTKDEKLRAYSITQMKNGILRVIDLLQGEKFIIIGHGMGAQIAHLYASQQPPKNLLGVVLLAPLPLTGWRPSREVFKKYEAAYKSRANLEDFTRRFLAHTPIDEHELRNLVDDGMKDNPLAKDEWLSHGMGEDLSHGLAKVKVPVVVSTARLLVCRMWWKKFVRSSSCVIK